MTAIYRHGQTTMIDYTPSADVSAGAVIAFGAGVVIAHLDIEANRLGAVALNGGVYELPKASGAGLVFDAGDDVFFDPSAASGAGAVTDDDSAAYLGKAVQAATDGAASVLVAHLQPVAHPGAEVGTGLLAAPEQPGDPGDPGEPGGRPAGDAGVLGAPAQPVTRSQE